MKKVFQNTSETIHVFAQQTQSEGRNSSSSVYFRENKIYSYGSHYLLGEFISPETIIINDFGYSVSTSKHISELKQATYHKERFFTSSICIKSVENDIKGNLKRLINARKPELYINTILQAIGCIHMWAAYCKENKFINEYRLMPSNTRLKKLQKISRDLLTPDYLAKIKAKGKTDSIKLKAKNKKELKIKLIEFNTYKISRFNIGDFDYLRLSENGLFVETSQNIKIDLNDARKLYIAIKRNIDITGYKIGYYTVNSINGTLKVGCHNIDIKSVHSVGEQILNLKN
tara:strand:- start:315 stop:1175 length:861 start_codon:yes stop_codon:yes gene_type:complete